MPRTPDTVRCSGLTEHRTAITLFNVSTRGEEAVEALVEALEPLGLVTVTAAPRQPSADADADLVFSDATGRQLNVQVKRLSTLTPSVAAKIQSERRASAKSDTLLVLVADRVTPSAQELLRVFGIGWLDLRGHLRLAGPGLLVDADVPAVRPRQGRTDAFGGSAGLEVACQLLMHPHETYGVRELARLLHRSASTISDVLKSLHGQRLVKADNKPLLPDLFWETAHAWRPSTIPLASLPPLGERSMNDLLELGTEQVESGRGWALTDTMAAVAYGAPIGVRSGYPPDFYVPSETVARRATQLLGSAANWETRAMTIRVAPVPAVCSQRVDLASEHWPVVHPLFAALDLASDPARGREVLQDWTPLKTWRRVW